jgi:NAD/NADP transhydrogenase beta subunit
MTMFSRAFWIAATERAIKTFAQTLAALLVADGTGLLNTAWIPQLSVAGMALVVSLLTSVASAGAAGPGPSLANEVAVPEYLG